VLEVGGKVFLLTTQVSGRAVVAVRLNDDLARSRLGIVWRSRPSHAARALLLHLL
jgi:hypothetical protein